MRPAPRTGASDRTRDLVQAAKAAGGGAGPVGVDRKALRGDLDAIVLKALRKEPARRYASAAALREDLERYGDGRPVLARPEGAPYRLRKFVRRHYAGVAGTVLLTTLVLAGAVGERILPQRAEAQARTTSAVEHYLRSLFYAADPFGRPDPHAANLTARALLDRGTARIDSSLAGQPALQAELRSILGVIYSDLNVDDRAATLLRAALVQRRALDGPRSVPVAQLEEELGVVLGKQEHFDEAERLLRQALAQQRLLFGARDTATATTLHALASLAGERGDLHPRNRFSARRSPSSAPRWATAP